MRLWPDFSGSVGGLFASIVTVILLAVGILGQRLATIRAIPRWFDGLWLGPSPASSSAEFKHSSILPLCACVFLLNTGGCSVLPGENPEKGEG
jgi:hypothetical protein